MLEVGVYVDYKHNDQTLAAIQVANWFLSLGYKVKMVSDGPIAKNVDEFWDSRVIRHTENNLSWMIGINYVCWFYPHTLGANVINYFAHMSDKERPQHVYFPGFSSVNSLNPGFFGHVDKTICLNRDIALWLSSNVYASQTNQRWADLTSCDKVMYEKCGRFSQDSCHLTVVLGGDFVENIGVNLLVTLDKLLSSVDSLKISLVSEKTLPRQYRSQIKRLARKHLPRVVNFGVIPYSRYSTIAYLSDFIYIASASFRYGSLISHLGASGTPLICHDLPPARSYLANGISGLIIPTTVSSTSHPIGQVSFLSIFDTLKNAVELSELSLRGLQKNSYEVRKKKAADFGRFLQQEFS
jgi:hypothetical protein